MRLRDGLERDIPLVLAKATIALLEAEPNGVSVIRAGLDFGVARRGGRWFHGLTTLTCFNVPARRLPTPAPSADPDALLAELPALLDRQQQVDEARHMAASFPAVGGAPRRLVAALGAALVREDRNFHTIQCVEAAVRQHELLADPAGASLPLVAAAGYLAAYATTTRSQRQIARRLHRGEQLYDDDAT